MNDIVGTTIIILIIALFVFSLYTSIISKVWKFKNNKVIE